MRGRKPKPIETKRAAGNPGKRKLQDGIDKVDGLPEAPDHLSELAREEWDRIVAQMTAMGTLGRENRAVLAIYCQNWGLLVTAENMVAVEGAVTKAPKTGVAMHNPWLTVARRASEIVARLAAELGLTPASRQRVAATGGKKSSNRFTRNGKRSTAGA